MTVKVNVFAPTVAAQFAVISAVIAPLLFAGFVTLRPVGTLDAVTVKLPAAVKSSETVAMGEVAPALPCCRETDAAGVIVGAPLTVKVNEAVAVAPQLSVAVTVIA